MAHLQRLAMVILMETDIEKAVAFYEAMGAHRKCLFPKSWAELTLDELTIALCHTESDQGQRRTGLVFAVEDLSGFYEKHKHTAQFLEEPVTKLHGIMVSVQDPGGNIIELYQATPEKVREFMEKNQDSGCCKQEKESNEDTCCRS
jgi:catechol 2,3-dioxygenase-like lactoylglutathione lyase family enzyme